MTFDAQEQSVFSGTRGEFFHFALGATHLYLTSGDVPATITGHLYVPGPVEAEEIKFSDEEWSGNVVVRLPHDHAIAALLSGPPSPVPLTLVAYHKHRSDPAVVQYFGPGEVVTRKQVGAKLEITFAPISRVLKRLVPSIVFQSQCPYAVYGVRCGADPDDFARSVTLTAIDGSTLSGAAFDAEDDGWFTAGYVELASGDRRYIVAHVGDTVTLFSPFPEDAIAVDDEVTAFAGCDGLEATCDGKFDRLDSYIGFPRIPWRNPTGGID